MPIGKPLTDHQLTTLRAFADGTIETNWDRIGERTFIRYRLVGGRDCSSQTRVLRKKRYLRWEKIDGDPPRNGLFITELGKAELARYDRIT